MPIGGLGANNACDDTSPPGMPFYGGKGICSFINQIEKNCPPNCNVDDVCLDEEWGGLKFGGIWHKSQCDFVKNIEKVQKNNKDNKSNKFYKELHKGCYKTFDEYYHGNWEIKFTEVECPTSLTKITGCIPDYQKIKNKYERKNEKEKLFWNNFTKPPKSSLNLIKNNYDNITAIKLGITSTMMDCCKPSCAWSDPIITEVTNDTYSRFYMCDANGNRVTDFDQNIMIVNGKKKTCIMENNNNNKSPKNPNCNRNYEQCNGILGNITNNKNCCQKGWKCFHHSIHYSQCIPEYDYTNIFINKFKK